MIGVALDDWALVRVAGLPAAVLGRLSTVEAPARLDELMAAERQVDALCPMLADELHEAVSRTDPGSAPSARALRRQLLDLRRRVFNQRALPDPVTWPDCLSPTLRDDLTRLHAIQARRAALLARYRECLDREWARCEDALVALLDDPRLLNGLLVSSRSLAESAFALAQRTPGSPLSRRERRRLSAIGMYVTRAAYRTTPLSSLAMVGLVNLRDEAVAEPDASPVRSNSIPSLSVRRLAAWLGRRAAARPDTLPLRATPFRRVVGSHPPRLRFLSYPTVADGEESHGWYEVDANDDVENILAWSGFTIDQMSAQRRRPGEPAGAFEHVVRQLREAGLLVPQLPPPAHTSPQLRTWAKHLHALGIEATPLCGAAERLDEYANASPARRLQLLDQFEADFPGTQGPVLFEDVIIEGASSQLPLEQAALIEQLEPLVHLCRSSATELPHYLLCSEFLRRFGAAGRCEDVGAFVTELLEDEGLVDALRTSVNAPAWATSPLVGAIETADGPVLRCDPAWLNQLPYREKPGAVSVFLQSFRAGGEDRLVLNGIQAGRHKYLSRFLLGHGQQHQRARAQISQALAADDPLPIALSPHLGLNFQLHPPLCPYELELPGEPPSAGRTLPLSDLVLSFDEQARALRLRSRSINRDVEPLHLGFLRDSNLPAPLLLLRALAPRYRDDLLSERVSIYQSLDALAMSRNSLPFFRPRLELGALVLERARWAIPLAEVPDRESHEDAAAFFHRVARWRMGRGLPGRGVAQRLLADPVIDDTPTTPFYVDWNSPITLMGLHHYLGAGDRRDGWLLLRELLPEPEAASFALGEERHTSELMIQLRW